MESGILMIVIVVMGIFYPAYTAWISLVEAPVYLKIGFLFTMSGALLVMRILRKEKQIKWMVLLGILGVYAWSLYSWYDEECHYQYARSVHGDSGNALMLFVGTFTCLIPLFLLDAELTRWMESRKKKKEESPESEKETEKMIVDVYDPKVEMDIKTTTAGVSGSKTIEYMAIPRYAGDFEIPAIAFSYFDIKSGSYKTIKSEPYKLHVEQGKGGSGSSPVVSNFSNKESVKYLGKDIRYLKTKGFSFIEGGDGIFFGSFMYYLCYIVPAILFIVFFFIYRKQVKENADIALVRTKKANKMAVRRLKNAGKLMKENKKEEFYDEVLRALWGYLSDKLSIPQSDLTKDNVETELAKYGVDESLTNEFMDILNTCEFARYAPSQASDAMDKLYELTVDAIGKMENTIKK